MGLKLVKKKKQKVKSISITIYCLCVLKNHKQAVVSTSGNREKFLKQKGIGAICANKEMELNYFPATVFTLSHFLIAHHNII